LRRAGHPLFEKSQEEILKEAERKKKQEEGMQNEFYYL
jgi:hypothetical protein